MSRANRLHAGAPEDGPRACDYYATPAWATASIMPLVMSMRLDVIIDPCAGDGAILREARDAFPAFGGSRAPKIMGFDIRPEAVEQCVADGLHVEQMDFFDDDAWSARAAIIDDTCVFDPDMPLEVVFVMNPPYGGRDNTAQRFVDACLRRLSAMPKWRGSVVALLRLMWLNDGEVRHKRGTWLRETAGLPDVALLPRRPSFTGGPSDATTYAWMTWRAHARRWTKSTLTMLEDTRG